jgi:hypothetical protein
LLFDRSAARRCDIGLGPLFPTPPRTVVYRMAETGCTRMSIVSSVVEREWVLRWIIEIPDIHVSVCMILDKLPKGDKKDASTVFIAETFSQIAFLIQNPDKQNDRLAEFQAGVDGALRVYEVLLKANPKDRQPFLDDLTERRDSGTLAQFVKERAEAACKK